MKKYLPFVPAFHHNTVICIAAIKSSITNYTDDLALEGIENHLKCWTIHMLISWKVEIKKL